MYFKSGLQSWQLAGKTNVYGTAPTAALHILFASPTSARQDFNLDPEIDRVTARDRSAPKIARLDRPTRLGSVLAT